MILREFVPSISQIFVCDANEKNEVEVGYGDGGPKIRQWPLKFERLLSRISTSKPDKYL